MAVFPLLNGPYLSDQAAQVIFDAVRLTVPLVYTQKEHIGND